MRGILDYQTAEQLVEKRITLLERERSEGMLSDDDEQELVGLRILRERVSRASIKAIEIALDELES
jgi:hypothetical protein